MSDRLAEFYNAYKRDIEDVVKPDNTGGYSFVWGFGNENADVCLIGEAPGREEVEKGRPFVGKAGSILDEFLKKTGIEREKLFITNTVKYRLARMRKGTADGVGADTQNLANRPARTAEIERGAMLLSDEIRTIKPKIVVTMGNVPLKAILSIADDELRGSVGELHGRVITTKTGEYKFILYPIYHPASLIYNRALAGVYEEDLINLNNLVKTVT